MSFTIFLNAQKINPHVGVILHTVKEQLNFSVAICTLENYTFGSGIYCSVIDAFATIPS